jgi:hypothetical protein
VRTIGVLEPSYVIRKFLDAQRIHNLTIYLQALHQKVFRLVQHHLCAVLCCVVKLTLSLSLSVLRCAALSN